LDLCPPYLALFSVIWRYLDLFDEGWAAAALRRGEAAVS
jgi:hypothetical protein